MPDASPISSRSLTLPDVAVLIFFAGALTLPISIVIAQVFFYALVGLWSFEVFRKNAWRIPRSPMVYFIAIFVVAAVLSAFLGVRPERSVGKLHRIVLGLAFAIPWWFQQHKDGPVVNLNRTLWMFALGTTLLALFDLVRISYMVLVKEVDLFDLGNMRDPQFYMFSLCWLTAWLSTRKTREGRGGMLLLIVLSGLGLLLHNKRGVWISFAALIVLLGGITRRWKGVLALCLIALLSLAVPKVRERAADLRNQFSGNHGGRLTLWTQIAPPLIADHPMGMGFKSTRFEDFQGVLLRKKNQRLHAIMPEVEVNVKDRVDHEAEHEVLMREAQKRLKLLDQRIKLFQGLSAPAAKADRDRMTARADSLRLAMADAHLEVGLDHLHNNLLQILVETGWLGAFAWVGWMLTLLISFYRATIRLREQGDPAFAACLGVTLGFTGLLLNGMVEYNFGDGEIFMLYCVCMGLCAVMFRRSKEISGAA